MLLGLRRDSRLTLMDAQNLKWKPVFAYVRSRRTRESDYARHVPPDRTAFIRFISIFSKSDVMFIPGLVARRRSFYPQ